MTEPVNRRRRAILAGLVTINAGALAACTTLPPGVEAVRDFRLDRYLGKWYSIARLDHWFERDLEQVTAEYSLRPDGDVRVVNRGWDAAGQRWKSVDGRAKFVAGPDVGRLKVSFFGPFYGGYNVIDLAPDYSYAMVAGPDTSYLWILARTPTLDRAVIDRLVAKARGLGFPVERLTFVKQTA